MILLVSSRCAGAGAVGAAEDISTETHYASVSVMAVVIIRYLRYFVNIQFTIK